jgi:hypothetical protein
VWLDRVWAAAARKLLPLSVAKSVPTTLCVIAALTAVGLAFDNCKDCDDCANCIEKTELGASLESFSGRWIDLLLSAQSLLTCLT